MSHLEGCVGTGGEEFPHGMEMPLPKAEFGDNKNGPTSGKPRKRPHQ